MGTTREEKPWPSAPLTTAAARVMRTTITRSSFIIWSLRDRVPGRERVAALREAFVTDGEHPVDQQDVGIEMHGHGETQADVHPGRVGPRRSIDELRDPRELDHLIELLGDPPS